MWNGPSASRWFDSAACQLDDDSLEPHHDAGQPIEVQVLRHVDVAGLQELVLNGVTTGVTLEALDEDDRRDTRWPQPCFAEGHNQG